MKTTASALDSSERLGYRPDEAAKIIGVGTTKLYALLKTGEIECKKVGTATLITPTALRKWVDSLPSGR